MATRYVDSNATGAANGTTWADAYTTLAAVAGVDTAGDIIYVAHNHSESTAGSISLAWAGTEASPTRIICANSGSGEPPTTLATTALVATTGSNGITPANGGDAHVWFYGIIFQAGDSTNNGGIILSDAAYPVYDACTFRCNGNNSSSRIQISYYGVTLNNCQFKFADASQGFEPSPISVNVMRGCAFEAGTTAINALFPSGTYGFRMVCEGCDWSAGAQGMNLFNSTGGRETVVFRDCKLPSGWTGALNVASTAKLSKFALHNCDAGDTNYRLETEVRHGNVYSETTLVRTGGATDGTTGLSWKLVSGGDAEYPEQYLESPEIVQWVDSPGSKTFTFEILHDSATNLKDDEVWMELMYLGTSGVPLGSIASDAKTESLTTAADQTDSSATWTTTGMSNPNTQKLNVTVTVNEKGFVHAVVKLAKASTTVYVCPKLDVT